MNDAEKIAEIQRLLDEAYDNYFEKSDGHCKSQEGAVTVSTYYGTYFDRHSARGSGRPATDYWNENRELPHQTVEVYSYVLGPSRSHTFGSLDEALEEVRDWHYDEMEHDYTEDGW